MTPPRFPVLALPLGITMSAALIFGSATGPDGRTALPILTLLFIAEFGFFTTAVGAYIGLKQIFREGIQFKDGLITVACMLLSLLCLNYVIRFWPL